jgi:hypothetical protein
MNTILSHGAVRGYANHVESSFKRAIVRRSIAVSSTRRERFLARRERRRRQGLIWGVLAAVILFVAWDLACRVDEVPYNPRSPSSESVEIDYEKFGVAMANGQT